MGDHVNTGGGDFVGRDHYETTVIRNRSLEEELTKYLQTAVARYVSTMQWYVTPSSAPSGQPYKDLYPFEIEDAEIYFGRDAAKEDLYETVFNKRLTVLHGKSGTGKTSLLKAGLSPRLIKERYLPVYVRRYDDPEKAIKRVVAPSMAGPWPESLVRLNLHEFLGLVCSNCLSHEVEELVVILDQFEEFFISGPEREHGWPFIEDLADCYDEEGLPVRFVIALRSDYFSHLATFGNYLPHIFHNQYYLEPMTREAARAAITEPVKRRGQPVYYDPTLLDNLLHDLKIVDAPTHPDIELPHLQIICTHLYEEASAKGETTITLDIYEKLGAAKGILGRYLDSRLKGFPGSEALIARDALKELVGSEATRRRLPRNTLVARVNVEGDKLDDVLARLVRARLLRRDEAAGETSYEVVHEYLVEEIREKWIDREDLKFKQIEEMLDREVANWNVHTTLIPRDRLQLLYEQRERLKGLPEEKWKLILSSALETNFKVLDWAEQAGEVGEIVLLARLDDQRQEIRCIAMEVLGTIWGLPEVSKLSASDPKVRQTAAQQLGGRDDQRILKPLSAVLRDKHGNVRREAAKALVKLGEPAVGPLFDALRDKDRDVRLSVARVIGELKLTDPRAIEPLIAASKDEDRHVRQAVLQAFVKLDGSRAKEVLCAALKDDDNQVRRTAVEGLIALDGSDAVQALSAALQDVDSQVRRIAVEGLIKLADSHAVQKLSRILKKDKDSGVRLAAVEGLVKSGGHDTVEPLVDALQDSDSNVREAAVEGLFIVGEMAVEPLMKTLSNKAWHLRRMRELAARALGKIGDVRATQSLIDTLTDEWYVCRAATEALGQLNDPEAVKPLTGVLRNKDANLRRAAAEALAKIGAPQVVEPLITALGDDDSGVRQVAAEALIKRGELAMESLINTLQKKDRTLRQEATQVLVRLGELAAEPLINALQDRNRNLRLAAIEGLAQLRDPRAVGPLIAVLEDRPVRQAAGTALVQIGGLAVEPLSAALGDKSKGRGFHRSVKKALKEIGTPEALAALRER